MPLGTLRALAFQSLIDQAQLVRRSAFEGDLRPGSLYLPDELVQAPGTREIEHLQSGGRNLDMGSARKVESRKSGVDGTELQRSPFAGQLELQPFVGAPDFEHPLTVGLPSHVHPLTLGLPAVGDKFKRVPRAGANCTFGWYQFSS